MTLNIVVPMAGRGSRFANAGYELPKPLIDVSGRPMIDVVIENLQPAREHRFVFVAQREHEQRFGLTATLAQWAPGCEVVLIDDITEGATCTVLETRHLIDSDDPLMIANSDQYIDFSIDDYLAAFDESGTDGFIMTMTATHPKWSFIRFDDQGTPIGVAEKQPVSDVATVGIYNYARGRDFVRAAEAMIAADDRVNGEFYVAPTYDHLVAAGGTIGYLGIGTDVEGMYGLGTPEDLDYFLSHPIHHRAVGAGTRGASV
jgi:dTDP-glucose pyrophosphorylase